MTSSAAASAAVDLLDLVRNDETQTPISFIPLLRDMEAKIHETHPDAG